MSLDELKHIMNRANNSIKDVQYLLSTPTDKKGLSSQSFRAIVSIINLMSILKDISDHKNDFNMSQTEEKNEMTSNRGLLLLGPGGSPPEPVFQDILSKVISMHNLIQNLYRVYKIEIKKLDFLYKYRSIDFSSSRYSIF